MLKGICMGTEKESQLLDVDKYLKLYNEKGYCLIKKPSGLPNEAEEFEEYKFLVDDIKKSLSKNSGYECKGIDYTEYPEKECHVIYNTEVVDINTVTKLSEFVEVIANEKSGFDERDHIYFRGHASTTYKVEPSIYRDDNKKILENEEKLYRDLLSTKPHFFDDCGTTLEKLVKMQHYGIPTRLLDLTDNPLIALYFACSSKFDTNGEVLVFNIDDEKFKYFDSDSVAVVANLSKCKFDFDISGLKRPYKTDNWNMVRSKIQGHANGRQIHDDYYNKAVEVFNQYTTVSELVHFVREDKPYFLNRIDPKHLMDYSVVVKAKMSIDRMVSQSGAFILFGINETKEKRSNADVNKEDYKQKVIIIPAEYKTKIINELKMFNINEATVFGDLDTTAKYFTNKYKK
jgi:hypothetical protein